MCFCYLWKGNFLLILNLFFSEYLDKIPPGKEMKEVFSVKLQTGSLCDRQNPCCPNKEYNAISGDIYHNIRTYSRIKKFALTNDWENVAHREETEPSERYAVSFYPHLSLETIFPALKLT